MKVTKFLSRIFFIFYILNTSLALGQNSDSTNLETAAEKGNIHAIFTLGLNYYKLKKYDKALPLFEKGAEKGSIPCINALAVMYSNGQGVKIDYNKAIELYKSIAAQGDTIAMTNLSETYTELLNFKEAIEWQLKALEHPQDSEPFPAENIKILGLTMDSSTIYDLEKLSSNYVIKPISKNNNYKIFSVSPKNIQLNNNQENLLFFDKDNILKAAKVSINSSDSIINIENLDKVFSCHYIKVKLGDNLYSYQVGEQFIEIKPSTESPIINIHYSSKK